VEAESALNWYFTEARSSLQPPSNYGRMVAAIGARAEQAASRDTDSWHVVVSTGSPGAQARTAATEVDERLLQVCDREYPVRRALAAVGERLAEVLEAGSWSAQGLEAFGSRAALAPLTRAARSAWLASSTTRSFGEYLVRLSWRVRKGVGEAQAADRVLAAQITREALGLWREAIAAYVHAAARYSDLMRARQRAAREARAWRPVEAVGAFRRVEAVGQRVGCCDAPAARTGLVAGIDDFGRRSP